MLVQPAKTKNKKYDLKVIFYPWLHNMLDFRIACEKYLEVHGEAVKRIVCEM